MHWMSWKNSVAWGSLLAVAICHLSPAAWAQEKSVRPGVNKAFENPDVANFVERFEREGREVYDQRRAIVAACKLKPGMAVADIGAGTGLFTRLLAAGVGRQGRVYAVDIAPKFVDHTLKECRADKLTNVVGVVCRADSCQLPANSIDLAFICATYHHFEFPHKTMRSDPPRSAAGRPGRRDRLPADSRRQFQVEFWDTFAPAKRRSPRKFWPRDSRDSKRKNSSRRIFLLVFRKVADGAAAVISKASRDQRGILVHEVRSPYQASTTKIKVLLPDELKKGDLKKGSLKKGERYRVLYVLPVEASEKKRYGDGLAECLRLDLHNKHRLICVLPTFSHLPWYADHPSDRRIMSGKSFIESGPAAGREDLSCPSLLVKAGCWWASVNRAGGRTACCCDTPSLFARAAAWDAPLTMTSPGLYGNKPIFATPGEF